MSAFLDNNPEIEDFEETKLIQYQLDDSEAAFSEILPENFIIQQKPARITRKKYTCHGCNTKVYGKHDLNIICADCDLAFGEV